MTTEDRSSNLMFLLTLSSVAACATGGSDPSTSSPPFVDPTTGGDDTASSGSSGGDTSIATSGVDGPSPTDGPNPGTTEGPTATTEPPGETTAGAQCEGTPPAVGQIHYACIDYIYLSNECYYDGDWPMECVEIYEAYCQAFLDELAMTYGETCVMADIELLVCLSQLSCAAFADDTPDCPEQQMFFDKACPM
jgi:hypothetical protein